MYNEETLRRKISKEGIDKTIKELSAEGFPLQIKKKLEVYHVFIHGQICLSKIYSLV